MKKILLFLTFIIACNFTSPCHARPVFTGRNNLAPVILMAAITVFGMVITYTILCAIFGNKKNNIIISRNNHNSIIRNVVSNNSSRTIVGSGTKGTKIVTLSNVIEKLSASDSGTLNLHMSQDDENTLEITTDVNILDYLDAICNNKTCSIKQKNNTSFNTKCPIIYDLYLNKATLASLNSVTASYSLNAKLSNLLTTKDLTLNASHSAIIGGEFNLDTLNIKGNNSAEIIAKGAITNANVTLSHSSKAQVNTQCLTYDIQHSSTIEYNSNATSNGTCEHGGQLKTY
jgi:Putative auto-transporter adhesin, head GIN domain